MEIGFKLARNLDRLVMAKKIKDEEIMHELYRRAFAVSTPPGDFDELMAKAEINEFGQKVIPFMDYECPHEVMEKILEDAMVEFKVPKHRIKAFSFNFWLGCSPKSAQPK
jgi:hypothetical protein